MGCDIHLYIERKINGKWEEVEVDEKLLPNERHYRLFAFLADIRNLRCFPSHLENINSQFENRGIPEDTSMPKDFYLGDHSFTHAYLTEILLADWKKYGLQSCYFIIFFEYVLKRLIDISKEDEKNLRVIIGFDN